MLLDTDKNRLFHMVQAAEQAIAYAEQHNIEEVKNSPPLQHLLIRNLEILGEAAARVTTEFREAHPEIPWRNMIDMRNRLIHAYFDTNLNIIWETVQKSLPPALKLLRDLLEKENSQ